MVLSLVRQGSARPRGERPRPDRLHILRGRRLAERPRARMPDLFMTCPECGYPPTEEGMQNPESIRCVICKFEGHAIEWLDDNPDEQEVA